MMNKKIEQIHLQTTLNLLFNSEERKNIAYSLLSEIKLRQRSGNSYKASERIEFCKKHDFSIAIYDQVLYILKKHGLVKKSERNSLLLSNSFLDGINAEWRRFLFE